MHEIRKNHEKEVEILRAGFKAPKILKILAIVYLVVPLVGFAAGSLIDIFYDIKLGIEVNFKLILLYSIIPSAVVVIIWLCLRKFFRKKFYKQEFVLTNKRVYGYIWNFLVSKNYSYRFDQIESVELETSLGATSIVLRLATGAVAVVGQDKQKFAIAYLKEPQRCYEKLCEVLCSIKNDKDVAIDIEMSRIEIEKRKADTFEKIVQNNGSVSAKTDLQQLKELNELLKEGIITKEEFELKKKQILGI